MEKEQQIDRIMSVHSMSQSLQTQMLTAIRRGSVNDNLKAEMKQKLEWMLREITDL